MSAIRRSKHFGILGYKTYKGKESWAFLWTSSSLPKYYRHLYYLSTHRTNKLEAPSRPAHITVIAGKYETLEREIYDGEKIEFYIGNPENNGLGCWALPVYSNRLNKIREELGLPYRPLHLCIGYEERYNERKNGFL